MLFGTTDRTQTQNTLEELVESMQHTIDFEFVQDTRNSQLQLLMHLYEETASTMLFDDRLACVV